MRTEDVPLCEIWRRQGEEEEGGVDRAEMVNRADTRHRQRLTEDKKSSELRFSQGSRG